MKNTILHLFLFLLLSTSLLAQNDTIYFMKYGHIVHKQSIKPADVDSVIFYKPTVPGNTFFDIRDGNIYRMESIGNMTWMAENLRYLPEIHSSFQGSSSSPRYYVYGYNGNSVEEAKATENYTTFGVLYNWPAAMAGAQGSLSFPSGVQGICPANWHLPSAAEWDVLVDAAGGETIAGMNLKATEGWIENGNGDDEFGFTALPAGFRDVDGGFGSSGSLGYWWTTTILNDLSAYRKMAYNSNSVFYESFYEGSGYSVRCVKD